MQLDASLSWLALALKPGLASCLSARVLRKSAEDVIEELPTPVRAALVQAEQPGAEQRNRLAVAALNGSEKKLYELLSSDEPMPIGTFRVELFRCSRYAFSDGDERYHPAVVGEIVQQSLAVEADRSSHHRTSRQHLIFGKHPPHW